MKSVLEKVFHGALYGLGFGIIVGGIFYYLTNRLSNEAMSQFSTAPDAVEISSHRKLERDGKLLILGELKNTSDDDTRGIWVTVDLYLDNEFVKQCEESVRGTLAPGESRNVEISCGGGCKNNPIVEHDTYEIFITSY